MSRRDLRRLGYQIWSTGHRRRLQHRSRTGTYPSSSALVHRQPSQNSYDCAAAAASTGPAAAGDGTSRRPLLERQLLAAARVPRPPALLSALPRAFTSRSTSSSRAAPGAVSGELHA